MKPVSANGVTGHILDNFDGTYSFRVYGKDHTYVDYAFNHCDLIVTIDDHDAFFYTKNGVSKLDHDPMTLGLNDD